MNGILDFLWTKKMWIGGIIYTIKEIITMVQVAIADEAITFDEAEGIWLAITGAGGLIAIMTGVYKARNAPERTNSPVIPAAGPDHPPSTSTW